DDWSARARTREAPRDQTGSGARRAPRRRARGAVREARGGRAVLPQQPPDDGASRVGRVRGSSCRLPAREGRSGRRADRVSGFHGSAEVSVTGLNLVPMVVEQTARGERAYDIYSRLLKDRVI